MCPAGGKAFGRRPVVYRSRSADDFAIRREFGGVRSEQLNVLEEVVVIEIVGKGLSPRWALVLIAAATVAAACTTASVPSSTATTAPPKFQPSSTASAQPRPAATVIPTGAPEANLPSFSCENKKQVFGQGPQPMPSLV